MNRILPKPHPRPNEQKDGFGFGFNTPDMEGRTRTVYHGKVGYSEAYTQTNGVTKTTYQKAIWEKNKKGVMECVRPEIPSFIAMVEEIKFQSKDRKLSEKDGDWEKNNNIVGMIPKAVETKEGWRMMFIPKYKYYNHCDEVFNFGCP